MRRVSAKFSCFFQPLQFGIITKEGTDALVHGMRRVLRKFGRSLEPAMLSVNMKNAFNLCNRAVILDLIKNNIPQIYLWVKYCYGAEMAYLFDWIRCLAKRVIIVQ